MRGGKESAGAISGNARSVLVLVVRAYASNHTIVSKRSRLRSFGLTRPDASWPRRHQQFDVSVPSFLYRLHVLCQAKFFSESQ